ncbi:hypothetical protein [Streptomyces sp. NPDC059262]|uniref:hypothetical protein n=1 Tax=Streptomyces sp. NPDC059262 TaxID=3346797 RepID=UPI0036750755
MLFFAATALVCAVAQDVWTLIAARFVMGIGVGMDIAVVIAFVRRGRACRRRRAQDGIPSAPDRPGRVRTSLPLRTERAPSSQ